MTQNSRTRIRHSIRPLSVFTYCGQPIPEPRDEYRLATKDLPLCADCQRARQKARQALGGRHRRVG